MLWLLGMEAVLEELVPWGWACCFNLLKAEADVVLRIRLSATLEVAGMVVNEFTEGVLDKSPASSSLLELSAAEEGPIRAADEDVPASMLC